MKMLMEDLGYRGYVNGYESEFWGPTTSGRAWQITNRLRSAVRMLSYWEFTR